ncbi:hypothetical protein [Chitinophaga caseinilytica]|uniref:FecR N-terminal domain-containing protein n=1 Tax=Chitinophaga caseinilytica TaxID=2267521 RepID=A0ABZ2Z0X9_9BACT
MSYQDYEAADFAAEASFQAWVQRTDDAAARFWEQWAAAHPEKREALREAQWMVRSFRFHATEVDPAEMDALKAAIDGVLDAEDRKKTGAFPSEGSSLAPPPPQRPSQHSS